MTLQDILRVKGSTVLTIAPTATLGHVVQKLVQNRCGSLVVSDTSGGKPKMVGIITERDILRACADRRGSLDDLMVTEYMTHEKDLLTGTPANSVEHIMGIMTDHRVRHLPVLDGDDLVGIISIGDVVKAQHHQILMENHYLKSYIQS
jgi:CBS domain-containing protein